jgi:hypothetical protein
MSSMAAAEIIIVVVVVVKKEGGQGAGSLSPNPLKRTCLL